MKLKHGDKVRINFKKWLGNCNEISFGDGGDYCEEVEYEYSLHENDQALIEFLFKNTIFTIDMIDQRKNYKGDAIEIITLKELELFDGDNNSIFTYKDLIKLT